MSADQKIIDHYTHGALLAGILQALQDAGKDLSALTPDDLAPVDELHIGGRVATAHLMTYLQFQPDHHILDIGSGLGGAARYLAAGTKARITGIDITPEYCAIATDLTARTGLADFIQYRQGNALSLPFEDGEFDGAYTIHTTMNIADKAALFREIYRVLKTERFFGLYDVMSGPRPEPLSFPVPWAETEESSHLKSPDQIKALLTETGFTVLAEDDLRGFALLMLKKLQESESPLGPRLVFGGEFDLKIRNLIANIEQQKCAPRVMICKKETYDDEP